MRHRLELDISCSNRIFHHLGKNAAIESQRNYSMLYFSKNSIGKRDILVFSGFLLCDVEDGRTHVREDWIFLPNPRLFELSLALFPAVFLVSRVPSTAWKKSSSSRSPMGEMIACQMVCKTEESCSTTMYFLTCCRLPWITRRVFADLRCRQIF